MKKILSVILTVAMLMSAAVLTVGAADENIGIGSYAPLAPSISADDNTKALDADQKDDQGIYYTLDDESMTAIVGMNTYADSASAGVLNTDSIVIPTTVTLGEKSYTVSTIGRNAFDGTAVREVVILGTPVIGEFAFAGCTSLETVYASDATEIKGFAFWGCAKLNVVNITGVSSIGGGAFWNCSNLSTIAIGADTIMEKAFADTGLTDVVFLNATAPAVAAGAFEETVIGYIPEDASGYDTIGIMCMPMGQILAVETAYATAGETVDIAVTYLNGMGAETGASFKFDLLMNSSLTIEDVLFGAENGTIAANATLDGNSISGTIISDDPSVPVVILRVKVAEDATGSLEINVTPDISATVLPGAVIVCDHAETETVTVKAASCEEAGEVQIVCAACRTVIKTEEVAAKGHDYTDFVIAPTCTEGGYTRHICNCCSNAYSDEEVEALGHVWNEGEIKVEASSSKEGLITYTCTTCGFTRDEILPKIKYGDVNEDNKVNLSDVTLMLQAIAKWDMTEKSYNETNADVNVDDKVNLGDVSMVLKHIAKWDVTFGPADAE